MWSQLAGKAGNLYQSAVNRNAGSHTNRTSSSQATGQQQQQLTPQELRSQEINRRKRRERLELLRELKGKIHAVVDYSLSNSTVAANTHDNNNNNAYSCITGRELSDRDLCVRELCLWLERALWHGLKQNPKDEQHRSISPASTLAAFARRRNEIGSSSSSSRNNKAQLESNSELETTVAGTISSSPSSLVLSAEDRAGYLWDWISVLVLSQTKADAGVVKRKETTSVDKKDDESMGDERADSSSMGALSDIATAVTDTLQQLDGDDKNNNNNNKTESSSGATPVLSRQNSDATITDNDNAEVRMSGTLLQTVCVEAIQCIELNPDVHTKLGKARAWVRAMINKGILANALDMLTNASTTSIGSCVGRSEVIGALFVPIWFEPSALLRDPETSSLLVSMLLGLETLNFNLDEHSSAFDQDKAPHVNQSSNIENNSSLIGSSSVGSGAATKALTDVQLLRERRLAQEQQEADALQYKLQRTQSGSKPTNNTLTSTTGSIPNVITAQRPYHVTSLSSVRAAIGDSFSRASRAIHSSSASSSSSSPFVKRTSSARHMSHVTSLPIPILGTPIDVLVSTPDTCTIALLQPSIGVPDVIVRCISLLWCAPAIHTQDLFMQLLRSNSNSRRGSASSAASKGNRPISVGGSGGAQDSYNHSRVMELLSVLIGLGNKGGIEMLYIADISREYACKEISAWTIHEINRASVVAANNDATDDRSQSLSSSSTGRGGGNGSSAWWGKATGAMASMVATAKPAGSSSGSISGDASTNATIEAEPVNAETNVSIGIPTMGCSAEEVLDPHTVANLLKLILRQLPGALIPFDVFDAFVACQVIGDRAACLRNLSHLVSALPNPNKHTLELVMALLARMCSPEVIQKSNGGAGCVVALAKATASAVLRPDVLGSGPPDIGRHNNNNNNNYNFKESRKVQQQQQRRASTASSDFTDSDTNNDTDDDDNDDERGEQQKQKQHTREVEFLSPGALGHVSDAADVVALMIENYDVVFAPVLANMNLTKIQLHERVSRIICIAKDSNMVVLSEDENARGGETITNGSGGHSSLALLRQLWDLLDDEEEEEDEQVGNDDKGNDSIDNSGNNSNNSNNSNNNNNNKSPGEDVFGVVSRGWLRRGFVGMRVNTELRGGGVAALKDIVYFVTHHTHTAKTMIRQHAITSASTSSSTPASTSAAVFAGTAAAVYTSSSVQHQHQNDSNEGEVVDGLQGFPFIQASVQLSKLTLELLGFDSIIRELNSISIKNNNNNNNNTRRESGNTESLSVQVRAVYASECLRVLACESWWSGLLSETDAVHSVFSLVLTVFAEQWNTTHATAMDFNKVKFDVKQIIQDLLDRNPRNTKHMWEMWEHRKQMQQAPVAADDSQENKKMKDIQHGSSEFLKSVRKKLRQAMSSAPPLPPVVSEGREEEEEEEEEERHDDQANQQESVYKSNHGHDNDTRDGGSVVSDNRVNHATADIALVVDGIRESDFVNKIDKRGAIKTIQHENQTITNETTSVVAKRPNYLPVLLPDDKGVESLTLACSSGVGDSGGVSLQAIEALEAALPQHCQGYNWRRVFSTQTHGFSLDKLIEVVKHESAGLLLIKTKKKELMGAFVPTPLTFKSDYHAAAAAATQEGSKNGSAFFLFTIVNPTSSSPSLSVFRWTGVNDCGALVTEDALAFGGGGNGGGTEFGLYLDFDLKAGTTGPCATFGNEAPILGSSTSAIKRSNGDTDGDSEEDDDDDCTEFRCAVVEFFKFTTDKV